jgi:hypothetical protein
MVHGLWWWELPYCRYSGYRVKPLPMPLSHYHGDLAAMLRDVPTIKVILCK